VSQTSILNALPADIALVDGSGVILSVNESWSHFAKGNGLKQALSGVGQNYLDACDRITGELADAAHRAAGGIRGVLSGATDKFEMEFLCPFPDRDR
jgi:hypothetical protein